MRILMLHGAHQNKEIFKQKTEKLTKVLKGHELVYVTAPNTNNQKPPLATWLTWDDNKTKPQQYEYAEDSITFLMKILEQEGPFDGIIGFSQGATMAALLCALTAGTNLAPRFAIMFSGFAPCPSKFCTLLYENKPNLCRSLHVYGLKGEAVLPEESRKLAASFPFSKSVEHPGKHYIPTTAAANETVLKFVNDCTNN